MPKFRKKPVVIEAEQWDGLFPNKLSIESWPFPEKDRCDKCGIPLEAHGRIKTLEGYHIVCPKDWRIIGIQGEKYPCKPDIFEQTYETDKYSMDQLEAITDKANEKRDNLFDNMEWKRKPCLTMADIRLVLEAMQELAITK